MEKCGSEFQCGVTRSVAETLHSDIRSTLHPDSAISEQLSNPTLRWTIDLTGLLRLNNRIYIPDVKNLWLHDHPISGHFVLFYMGIQYDCYIRMVKRRIILFAHLFPEVILLFLVGKYGRLPVE